jgi:hypothetical protein
MIMKAQGSIEFLVLAGSMMLFMLVILYINNNAQIRLFEFREKIDAKRVVDRIENEINVALEQGDGYSRDFMIPRKIAVSRDYNALIYEDGSIEITWGDHSYLRKLPTKKITDGFSNNFELSKDWNKVSNNNEIIQISGLSP